MSWFGQFVSEADSRTELAYNILRIVEKLTCKSSKLEDLLENSLAKKSQK